MARPTKPINLTQEQNDLLQSIGRSRVIPHSLVLRAEIILQAAQGINNKEISLNLGLCEDMVGLWRKRWVEGNVDLEKLAGKPKALSAAISQLLSDKKRSGCPVKFTAEQVCRLIALACEKPPEYLSHWTHGQLAIEAVKLGIVKEISTSAIGCILNQADLKPHRIQYWLNHEVEDEAVFRQEVSNVCELYHQAAELHEQGVHVVSLDEKTGMQALERTHSAHPMKPGSPEKVEFEYERHGTVALIANFEVATGRIISPTVGDTRTEEDLVAHICATVETDPQGEWIFICDQLNTHKSEGLVKLVAQFCGIEDELGVKRKSGIVQNMISRATFLQDASHRIRFVYTPKHCSWLNQVEIWFGILTRRLLKRGSFTSTAELKQRTLAFIEFFNETLAKPFRWTYTGKPLLA